MADSRLDHARRQHRIRFAANGLDAMRESQHKSGVPQKAALRTVRVESAQPYGWVVYIEGFAETHHFMSRSLALMYAHEWAKGNAPSVIQIVGPDGRIASEQRYNG